MYIYIYIYEYKYTLWFFVIIFQGDTQEVIIGFSGMGLYLKVQPYDWRSGLLLAVCITALVCPSLGFLFAGLGLCAQACVYLGLCLQVCAILASLVLACVCGSGLLLVSLWAHTSRSGLGLGGLNLYSQSWACIIKG